MVVKTNKNYGKSKGNIKVSVWCSIYFQYVIL